MSVILGAPSGFEPTLFPIAAAVSLADAIHETLGVDTRLKWPNDLLMNDKKVAGIYRCSFGFKRTRPGCIGSWNKLQP